MTLNYVRYQKGMPFATVLDKYPSTKECKYTLTEIGR